MRAAIMQPYLFPYLGYFQLIRSVDIFVVYDDVQYIKGGRINRNYILADEQKKLITLPLKAASPNKLINEIDIERNHNILRTIFLNYKGAPYFNSVFPIIEDILNYPNDNLACFLNYQLRKISIYLSLTPNWHISSSLKKDNSLRGQEKVLAICKELGANHYINATGGRVLYNEASFSKERIRLSFIQSKDIIYPQFKEKFISNLSIIDVMMFNHPIQCMKLLDEYEIS